MINHMRMLMINKNVTAIKQCSSVVTPPAYASVAVPEVLTAIERALWPTALAERVGLADDIIMLCSTGELRPFLTAFDPRVVLPPPPTYTDVLTTAEPSTVTEALSRLATVTVSQGIDKRVFTWDRHQPVLDQLYTAYLHGNGTLRLCALALAYTYQLERARGDLQ